jgi:hypothetical protein
MNGGFDFRKASTDVLARLGELGAELGDFVAVSSLCGTVPRQHTFCNALQRCLECSSNVRRIGGTAAGELVFGTRIVAFVTAGCAVEEPWRNEYSVLAVLDDGRHPETGHLPHFDLHLVHAGGSFKKALAEPLARGLPFLKNRPVKRDLKGGGVEVPRPCRIRFDTRQVRLDLLPGLIRAVQAFLQMAAVIMACLEPRMLVTQRRQVPAGIEERKLGRIDDWFSAPADCHGGTPYDSHQSVCAQIGVRLPGGIF